MNNHLVKRDGQRGDRRTRPRGYKIKRRRLNATHGRTIGEERQLKWAKSVTRNEQLANFPFVVAALLLLLVQDPYKSRIIHFEAITFIIHRQCIIELSFEGLELLFIITVLIENAAQILLFSFGVW